MPENIARSIDETINSPAAAREAIKRIHAEAKNDRAAFVDTLKQLPEGKRNALKQRIFDVRTEVEEDEGGDANAKEEAAEAAELKKLNELATYIDNPDTIPATITDPDAEGAETGEAQPEAKKESSMFGEIGTELTKEFASASLKMSKAKTGSEKFTIVMETIGTMSVKLMEAFGKFMEFMKDKLGGMGASALKSMASLGKFLPLPGFAKDLLNSVSNSERALLIDALKSTGKFTLVPDTSPTGKNADARALTALQAKFTEYKRLKEPAPAPAPVTPPATTPAAPAGTPATTPAAPVATPPSVPKPPAITFDDYMKDVVMPKVNNGTWKEDKKDANGVINLTLTEVVSAL